MKILYRIRYKTPSGMEAEEDRWFKAHRNMEQWLERRNYTLIQFSIVTIKDKQSDGSNTEI